MKYRKFSTFIEKTQYGYTAEETSSECGDAKYLRITDIVPYFVDRDRVPFCSISEKKKKHYLVKENDLLIARTGATTGYNLIVPKGFDNFIFASYLVRFFYKQNELYPLYLKHVLKSQQYYGFVNNYIGGSAQPGMNPKAFGRFEIPYVDYDTQKRIASILSAYDNLIELNNKRIKVLEQMAENLYKEWFVRFRFPGHKNTKFENGIPKEWEIKQIGEISYIKAGGDRPNIYSDTPTKDVSVPIYSNGIEKEGLYGFTNVPLITAESITISARGTVGYVCLRREPYVPIVRLIAVVPKVSIVSSLYLFYYLQRDSIVANGTSQQQITVPMVKRKKILVPPITIIKRFDEVAKPICNIKDRLKELNRILEKQRDLLLPRLMSGKLEVAL